MTPARKSQSSPPPKRSSSRSAVRVWISRGRFTGSEHLGTIWDREPKIFGSGVVLSWSVLKMLCPKMNPGECREFELRPVVRKKPRGGKGRKA